MLAQIYIGCGGGGLRFSLDDGFYYTFCARGTGSDEQKHRTKTDSAIPTGLLLDDDTHYDLILCARC